MKIIQATLLLFFISVLFFLVSSDTFASLNLYRPRCVGIQGAFITNSTWKGGSIQVGCAGDDGLAVSDPAQKCTGEVLTVRPGQTYRLTKCSCFGSDKGCLKIGKTLKLEPIVDGKRKITVVTSLNQVSAFTQNSCRVTDVSNVCGSNGQHITGNIKITCQTSATSKSTSTPTKASVPTNTVRSITSAPTPTSELYNSPTPTPMQGELLGESIYIATPTPSMVPTGNSTVMIGGIVGGILILLGGLLLLL